jgi:hypothetical protein
MRRGEEAQVWDPATRRFRPISEVRACTRPFALPSPEPPAAARRLSTFLWRVLLSATLGVMVILSIALARPGRLSSRIREVQSTLPQIAPAPASVQAKTRERTLSQNAPVQRDREPSHGRLAAGMSVVMEQSVAPIQPLAPLVASIEGAQQAKAKPREASMTVNVARGNVTRGQDGVDSRRGGAVLTAPPTLVNLSRGEGGDLLRTLAREGLALNPGGRIQHPVRLAASLGRDGIAHSIHPLSGAPTLMKAAVDAIKRSHYEPYRRDGQPVDMEAVITVNFTISAD